MSTHAVLACTCAAVVCAAAFPAAAFGPEPPKNDDCANASPIGDGATPFSNAGATGDGPAPCDLPMGNDIWCDYIATCTGNWNVNLCASDFDTVVGAYDGCGCPVGALLDCNDDFDFCGDGLQSIVNVPVVAGNCYKLQVGGFRGAVGSGTISSSCTVTPCPWDLDGNGAVDVVDFLGLLSQWGTDPGGPPDFDGDGIVGVIDFLDLLAHWGPCP